MRFLSFAASFAAIGLCALTQSASADGPVAEGAGAVARGTGAVVEGAARTTAGVAQGAAEGTRAVVGGVAQGTRAVVGGAADATRAAVGGAVDATGAIVGGAARGIRAGVNAITPGLPLQAQAGYRFQAGEDARDARWRFAQHNGEWWYYTPESAWMYHRDGRWNAFTQDNFTPNPALAGQQYAGEYGAGYRGVEQGDQSAQGADAAPMAQAQGRVYRLQHDPNGREFICDNGQRVYFDQGQASASGQQQWQAGYQPTPTPAMPQDPNAPMAAGNANGVSGQPGIQAGGQVGASTQQSGSVQTGAGMHAGASTQGAGVHAGASTPTQPGASVQGGASATVPAQPLQGSATGAASGAIQGSPSR